MRKDSRIFVAGHRGLVGSAVIRELTRAGYSTIVTAERSEVNLIDQAATHAFFKSNKIDFVIMAAAKVGGILYNKSYQADFLYENLMIAANVTKASADYGVEKLLFLGSSCIYPRLATQPIQESSLLTGPLEPTNEGYALAKIAGLKLCEKYREQYNKNFISAMPTNLYGPGDNFHPDHSHVIPGLIRRFHEAKRDGLPTVTIWGSGEPRREFLYVDDLANALLFLMNEYEGGETINIGCGEDLSIRELATLVQEVVGYTGTLTFDKSKPDGTPRKLLDTTKINTLGWKPTTSLKKGLRVAYSWALEHNNLSST
jgi:GDP-L-fucose synthase